MPLVNPSNGWNKDVSIPAPAVMCIVNLREREPLNKINLGYENFISFE